MIQLWLLQVKSGGAGVGGRWSKIQSSADKISKYKYTCTSTSIMCIRQGKLHCWTIHRKIKRVNPMSFHHKDFFSLSFYCYLHKKMDVSRTYCGNHSTVAVNQAIMLCVCLKLTRWYVNYFSIKLELFSKKKANKLSYRFYSLCSKFYCNSEVAMSSVIELLTKEPNPLFHVDLLFCDSVPSFCFFFVLLLSG